MGKQIMNSVISMTNNKQGYSLLALRKINQPEVADLFPAPPQTPKESYLLLGHSLHSLQRYRNIWKCSVVLI